jgi:16S rRNA C967 or C1407 C5-methylase (RsmB/RsmF family)/NOL1/NOP2/fmu family ribosome biogenesis protein
MLDNEAKIPKDISLPEEFERRMKKTLGAGFPDFKESLRQEPAVSIRLNSRKMRDLGGETIIPWCDTGFYLKERPVFTLDPHFHAGAYYVQEASSMFLEQAVKASVDLSQSLRVLDLCAAPGGKSTHLLNLINDKSLLVSNEVIRTRATILSENIQKWGCPNVVVTNNDPKDFSDLNGYFDLIVVDAPCSGEGLFRKDAAAIAEWSEENVNLCSLRQRRILSDVWPALKENGVLIYCTCTYNEAENEDNLKWLSEQKDIGFIDLPLFDGIQKTTGYRFLPHKIKGEGFFIAAIRKRSKEEPVRLRPTSLKISKNNPGWLKGSYRYVELDNLLIATPDFELPPLKFVTRGVAVASIMKNKLVPEHALALCTDLDQDVFPVMDLSKEEALKYLAKETIQPSDPERGFALVSYNGSRLGFVNRLGNRINNLYPANWRIRMNIRGRQ